MTKAILWAACATGFTALMTALGAATVFFLRDKTSSMLQKFMLGFAAGVMIAASMWSLLIPAIESAQAAGKQGWIPAAGGCILGISFLLIMDAALPHITPQSFKMSEHERNRKSKTALMVLAVTVHNIPEGMAVGISFALAAKTTDPAALTAAMALTLGIGIQNFPEGAAISLPIAQEGAGKWKSFAIGALSAIVEPIFGILTVLAIGSIQNMMPWLLSFAAGAMLYVVVEELIPQATINQTRHCGTLGVMFGFLIMMILDVALG